VNDIPEAKSLKKLEKFDPAGPVDAEHEHAHLGVAAATFGPVDSSHTSSTHSRRPRLSSSRRRQAAHQPCPTEETIELAKLDEIENASS